MKTVLHNNKIYEVTDWEYKCLVESQEKLDALPKGKREGSAIEDMHNMYKLEVFSKSDYKVIDKVIS